MYLSIYYPFSDFRDLRLEETMRNPTWPIFLGEARPFQQNLGEIIERPLGGIRGWVQEGAICEIKNSVEVSFQKATRVRKRFYSDGWFSGYFSIGISGLMHKDCRAYDVRDIAKIIRTALSRSVRSRHSLLKTDLSDFGEFATEIYANGATSGKRLSINDYKSDRWVRSSPPIIIVEIPSDRLSSETKRFLSRESSIMGCGTRFLPANEEPYEDIDFPIVIVEKNSRSEDFFSRNARMVLARLYCEFSLLQDAVNFLASPESGQILAKKRDYFCERMSESLSRLTGKKRLAALKDPRFYSSFTEVFLDSFELVKIDELANGLDVFGARRNLRQSLLNSHLWVNIANEKQLELVMEKIMGNKYENKGVVGAMGDNAVATGNTFSQNLFEHYSEKEIDKLKEELKILKSTLLEGGTTTDIESAAAISQAEDSLASQDSAGLVES